MSLLSTGSPTIGRRLSEAKLLSNDGQTSSVGREVSNNKHMSASDSHPEPLVSSKLGNFQPSVGEFNDILSNKKQKLEHPKSISPADNSEMGKLLSRLSPKPQPSGIKLSTNQGILTRLSEQQTLLDRQRRALYSSYESLEGHGGANKPSSILPLTSTSRPVQSLAQDIALPDATNTDSSEVLRLKQELLAANSRIALQEQELAQSRVIKHTLDQALGPPSEVDFNGREVTEQTISDLQNAFNASNPTFSQLQDGWSGPDDSQSDISDALSTGAYNRSRGFWIPPIQQRFNMNMTNQVTDKAYGEPMSMSNNFFSQDLSRPWGNPLPNIGVSGNTSSLPHRVFSGPLTGACSFDARLASEQSRYASGSGSGAGPRRSITQANRGGSCFPTQNSPWGTFAASSPSIQAPRSPVNRQSSTYQQIGLYPLPPYHQQPVGTPLSPTASEFTASGATAPPWTSSAVGVSSTQTYISPLEPLNYRRLLDKTVSCDWRYIVDKIVCNNDQQASIFLQQKLKVGTAEQKYEIIEAIVHQAYPLMINRFGNFLVQRCFEHGTSEQIVAIANAIKGNTLSLSMDPFGCHVIQKAFDCVPEKHKAVMVHELLRRIPETVIHRYACHVWQKLFELRWSGEPPQIMAKVNEALCGMWHEVALGETGSLVVQNIFENCVEDEKRPAIEEVLTKIDLLAHGQFGNWCIQHICEHGAPHDKNRAIEHILLWSVDYSMDQFASKIVEKCLKIGGSEFLDRYLTRVCTGRADRPRMPLIDIAGDQYGNYLIQWILMNTAPHQRELVASHIRKHMVSLRGSKFGSRVAMLCCNPSHITRPGPGAGMQIGRFTNFNDDRYQVSGQNGGRFNRGSQWNPNYPPFR
ncbi:pumilio-family RNA binding repeat protein [Aspergillus bombycis]|uniref:Pumilio-family RNA binding repeat protein n=1 Tax=Aspergillus bombycis TaxID=109264 RepID=A0A1F7ZVQ9_9EURO|nr:pumilio-family RNA binding repeat protein [Aspergillus bombycis]OGM43561.1 pumilio-family RNA binding repeat protein [Aspergillus bombycis]